MKHDLEGCREVILLINSVLKWEKPFYAGIVFGVVSFCFLIVWYLNLSTLTLISLVALTAILIEYGLPIATKFLIKSSNWTGVQEKAFEDICTEILCVNIKTVNVFKYLFVSKQEKTLMVSVFLYSTWYICLNNVPQLIAFSVQQYYITICGGLVVLAYLGSVIDNMLLTYFATLLIAFYPGLQKHGIVNLVLGKVLTCYSQKVNPIKDNTTKKIN